jgi:predicted permease
MTLWSRLRSWMQTILRRSRTESEMDAELRFHIETCAEDLMRSGVPREEALRRARLEFGGAERVKEECREARGVVFLESLLQDLRYGLRTLRKSPGFTAVVVLTLALGIGANTTVFSWLNATLLNALPGVADSNQVVVAARGTADDPQVSFSYPDFVDLRDRNHVLSGLTASSMVPISLTEKDRPQRLWGTIVSANYFDVLGVRPLLGRGFLQAEGTVPGNVPAVVLSYHLWQSRFGGNASVVGQTISLNSHPYTVVGIASPEFQGSYSGLRADLWVPVMMAQQLIPSWELLTARGENSLVLLGRLKPGISRKQAQAELSTRMQEIAREYPKEHAKRNTIALFPLWKAPYGAIRYLGAVLLMLTAIAGVVLLLACANVANLVLVRGVSRSREVAIRLALGASRTRLVRQLLTESVLLALLGGGVALVFTLWTSKSFMNFAPPSDLPIWLAVNVDRRVLLVSLAISLLTGALFGVLPALRVSGMNPMGALKDETGAVAGGRHKARLSGGLAVAQISLSLVMLICAGLMIRSFRNAQGFNPGFNPGNVLLASYDLLPTGYTAAQCVQFDQQLLTKLEAIPGVRSASSANWVPLGFSNSSGSFTPEGYNVGPHEVIAAGIAGVSPNYLRTMEISLFRGREFSAQDTVGSPLVVIINQEVANRYWPRQDAVGKRLRFSGDEKWSTVIGVARNSNYYDLNEQPLNFIYVPLYQFYPPSTTVHVRVSGDPGGFAMTLQSAIHELNSHLPVYSVGTLSSRIQVASGVQRIAGSTVGLFGLLALVLASVGIYGVVAYSIRLRTHEIGIRMALGASPSDIFQLVIGQGVRLIFLGAAFGLAAAFAVMRLLSSLLFGVSASEPFTFAGVTLLLVAVALLACYLPARRAMRVDPMVALRHG